MARFSIIIPTKDRKRSLDICLRHLERQNFRDFEIIVINDSIKRLELEKYDLEMTIIESNEQKGPAYLRNIAIPFIRTEYTVFLDDDCFVFPDWGEKIFEKVIKKNKDCAKGKILFDGNPVIRKYMDFQLWGYNNHRDFVSTCNTVIKTRIFANTGFDEKFDFAFEDVDFFKHIRKTWKIDYIPLFRVVHHGKCSVISILKTYFRYGQGKYIYDLKHKTYKDSHYILKYTRQIKYYLYSMRKIKIPVKFTLLIYFILLDIIKNLIYRLGFFYEKYKK